MIRLRIEAMLVLDEFHSDDSDLLLTQLRALPRKMWQIDEKVLSMDMIWLWIWILMGVFWVLTWTCQVGQLGVGLFVSPPAEQVLNSPSLYFNFPHPIVFFSSFHFSAN